ncbi:rod shape-determining protein RodA [Opitutaceae bacterium]|nr:rod shape-determining protein RodA [Opitutaceae bacterium]
MAVNLRTPVEVFSVFKLTTRERWDIGTPLIMAVLSVIGVAFIYSAQLHPSVVESDWQKQIVWLFLGVVIYAGTSLIDYRFWLRVVHWFYVASILLLILVLIPGVGTEAYGAQRWLRVGPVGFQPSDPAKIAVLLAAATILMREKVGSVSQSLGVLGKLALAVGIPVLLILQQPDIKPALILPPMVFSMLYVSRLSTRFFVGALGAFSLLVGIVAWDGAQYVKFMEENNYSYVNDRGKYEPHSWLPLGDYQRNRIISFTNPDKIDPMGISWNQRQSLISVGSGGLLGKGWTEGTQAQLGYLPRAVAHNDFIFSVIAEEKGLLGSLTVLSLFGLMLFNGIRIAGLARDRFGTLLALGVTVLFSVHVFVNIAMTVGLVPITGIPLPFISYGGSFLLSCCLLQGLVQSVYRFRKDFT